MQALYLVGDVLLLDVELYVACISRLHGEVHGALLVVEGEAAQVERAAVLRVVHLRYDQGVLRAEVDLIWDLILRCLMYLDSDIMSTLLRLVSVTFNRIFV